MVRKVRITPGANPPTNGPSFSAIWSKWAYGAVAPLALTCFAIHLFLTRHFEMPLRSGRATGRLILYGVDCIVFGIAWLGLATWLGFYFFFGEERRETGPYQIPQLVGIVTFGCGILFVLLRQFVF